MGHFDKCQFIVNSRDVARGATRWIIQCGEPTVDGLVCEEHKDITYVDHTEVAMSDESDVRKADRVEDPVVKRVTEVISDLTAGKVGRSARGELGDALERANRNANVQRAIR